MKSVIVLSDLDPVPSQLEALVSAVRFSDIVYQKRSIADYATDCLKSIGNFEILLLYSREHVANIARRIASSGVSRVVHLPTWLAPAELGHFKDRVQRLMLVEQHCTGHLQGQSVPAGAFTSAAYLNAILPALTDRPILDLGKVLDPEPHISIDLDRSFVDLRDPVGLIDLLSGAFSTRHFNRIERTRFHLRKFSSNVEKIKAEHDYYYQLSPEVQNWLVKPFDLQIDGDKLASYKMERLLMLDMGQQWINGSITVEEFERFLEDIFGFFAARQRRPCSRARAEQNFNKAYVDKVRSRKAQLANLKVGRKIHELMELGLAGESLEQIFETYLDLASDARRSLPDYECINHGDPCFSNILYDKRIRLVRLIDPRGAATPEDLWGDPHYDIAKLSHSALGGYDYIVNGLYRLGMNDHLGLSLTTSEGNWPPYAAAFVKQLEESGVDVRRIRILEVSLFLSMLPLHQDVPRNLVAFVLIAGHILKEVQNQ